MNNEPVTRLTPAEEDPLVHAFLRDLTRHSPRAGFADRVMAQIWRPAPAWVRALKRFGSAAVHPDRVWYVAGGLAAASAASFALLLTLTLRNWPQIETAWMAARGAVLVPAWRIAVELTTSIVTSAYALWTAFGLTQSQWAVFGILSVVTMVLCSWGFLRTLHQFNKERALNHAS